MMKGSGLNFLPLNAWYHEKNALCEYHLADAALAAARYKQQNGRWPESLEDCVPQYLPRIPSNPHNPKDCVRFDADPPRVYCVGQYGQSDPKSHRRYDTTGGTLFPYMEDCNGDQVLYLAAIHPAQALAAAMITAPGIEDIPSELALLNSKNDSDWRPAFRDLAHQGPRASIATSSLIPILNDPIAEKRMWTAYILGRIGRVAGGGVAAGDFGGVSSNRRAATRAAERSHQETGDLEVGPRGAQSLPVGGTRLAVADQCRAKARDRQGVLRNPPVYRRGLIHPVANH